MSLTGGDGVAGANEAATAKGTPLECSDKWTHLLEPLFHLTRHRIQPLLTLEIWPHPLGRWRAVGFRIVIGAPLSGDLWAEPGAECRQ